MDNGNGSTDIKEVKGGKTCSVACKLPNGLHLDINVHGQPLERVSVRGTNAGAMGPNGPLYPGRTAVGGYGITEGVNEEFFDAWLKLHAQLPVVKNGLIFKMRNAASAQDAARDRAGLRNYVEPVDPTKVMKGFERIQKMEVVDADA